MLSSKFDTERSADLQNIPPRSLMPGLTGPLSTPSKTLSSLLHLPVLAAVAEPTPAIRTTGTLTTGHFPTVTGGTGPLTTGRMPIVIPGMGRKPASSKSSGPLKIKHRVILHASVVFIMIVFVLTTLVAVLPLGGNGHALGLGGLLQNLGIMSMVSSNTKNSAIVAAQAATATAIMQNDGYDPGAAVSAQYNASLGNVAANGDPFPYGQCTYWADYRYHELTGHWVDWGGNAYQWAAGANASPGWIVSSTPHFPSIMVFQPSVQYADPVYGHVATVESINADGSVLTSNMNVLGYGSTVVDLTNYAGAGVSFVYHI
jgi:surface antigen